MNHFTAIDHFLASDSLYKNAARQGGIVSPVLFCVYLDGLLQRLRNSGVGCYIGNVFVGALAYADRTDDVALLAPTASAMRQLLRIAPLAPLRTAPDSVCALLNHRAIPTNTLLCRGACNSNHSASLEKYYRDIKQCLHAAASRCVPVVKTNIQRHWWTPESDDLKQQCIAATDLWKSVGRPQSGDVNSNRVRRKLKYKNAIKEAAADADSAFNDGLYDKLCKKDNVAFWKAWRNACALVI